MTSMKEETYYVCRYCKGVFRDYQKYIEHYLKYHKEMMNIEFPEMVVITH